MNYSHGCVRGQPIRNTNPAQDQLSARPTNAKA